MAAASPRVTLQITDVRRNQVVERREQVWREEDNGALPELVAAWRGAQAALLTRYHLTHPVPGERLFRSAPLPMQECPDNQARSVRSRAGQVTLSSLPLESGCRYSQRPTRGLLLRLGTWELQRDRRLPASRACASGYRLETGWRFGASLAVIVRVYSPGFEGPDATPLVVTGGVERSAGQ